jgi:hypothetical protein
MLSLKVTLLTVTLPLLINSAPPMPAAPPPPLIPSPPLARAPVNVKLEKLTGSGPLSTKKPRLLPKFRVKPPPVNVMGVEILGRTSPAAKVMLPVKEIVSGFGKALARVIASRSWPNVATKTAL